MDYIDTNTFIYWFTKDKAWGEKAMNIIKNIEAGEKAVTSALTVAQCHWILRKFKKDYRYDVMLSYLTTLRNLAIVPLTQDELVKADEASKRFNIELEDAIHYVTATACGCSTILSNDKDFDNTDLERKF